MKTVLPFENCTPVRNVTGFSTKARSVAILCIMLCVSILAHGTTYYLTSTGKDAAQSPASWIAGGGTPATNFTTSGDIFNIPSTIAGTFASAATYGTGVTLQFDGTATLASNATLTINGTIIFTNTSSPQLNINAKSSTFELKSDALLVTSNTNGMYGSTGSPKQSINNKIGGTVTLSTAANYELTGSAATSGMPPIVNNLTFSGAGTKTLSDGVTVNGTLSLQAGVLQLAGTNTSTFIGDVTINTGCSWNETGNVVLNFSGSLLQNGTFTTGTGLHTFSGTDKTIGGIVSISNMAVIGSYTNNGTLTVNTALSGTGNLIQGANSTLIIEGTSGITTLAASTNPNTVNYTGTSQTIKGTSYYNLGLSGSGTKTAGSNLTVSGNLSNSSVLDMGNYTLSVTGTITNTGSTIRFSGATNGLAIETGTIEYYNTSSAQSIAAGTYSTLATTGAGLKSIAGAVTTGTLTVTSGALTNNGTLTVNTTLSGTGTLIQGANSTLIIGGTSGITTLTASTNPNTVNYTGTSQSVKGTTYYNLELTGSGTKTAGNSLIVNGNLLNSGVLDMGNNTLSVTGTITNTDATIRFSGNGIAVSSGTVDYYGASQNIGAGTYATLNITGAGTKTAAGNITATSLDNGGTGNVASILNMGAYTLTSPIIDNKGGTIRFSGTSNGIAVSSGTVDYYGANQTIGAGTYATLTITSTGTKTAAGNITATNLDNGAASRVASVLDMGEFLLAATTISNKGGTIRFSGTSNGLAINSGTVEYYGAIQNITPGTYATLNITAAGTKTAAGNITASSLDNGGTGNVASELDMGIYTLTAQTIENTGGTILFCGASNGIAVESGTVEYCGDSQTVGAGTYSTLNIQGTGIKTMNGALTTVGTLNIRAGELSVGAGKKLTVNSALNNEGKLTLMSDATNGTATILTDGTVSTGVYSINQYLTAGRNWYISSPIIDAKGEVFSISETSPMYSYSEATGTSAPWTKITDPAFTLDIMKGYISTVATTGVVNFTGTGLNTGTLPTLNLHRTTGQLKEGFNLIGNPYPSYLNWLLVLANPGTTNLEPTMWYRTKTTGTNPAYVFDTFNSTPGIGTNNNGAGSVTQFIPPMQGFWVRVAQGYTSATLVVDNTMRSHDIASNRLKAPALVSRPLLRLQVSDGTYNDETVVYFDENAEDGFDEYDSSKMSNGNPVPDIFTLINSEKLVINGLKSLTPDIELPLGIKIYQPENYIIRANEISNFDPGTRIILKDNLLGTENDLTDGAEYTFSSVESSNTRFSVIFKINSVVTGPGYKADDNLSVYKNPAGKITVDGVSGSATGNVSVYNMMGRLLENKIIESPQTVMSSILDPGVYFVQIHTNGKSIQHKIVIN